MRHPHDHPPRIAGRLLSRMKAIHEDYQIAGDLHEAFHSIASERGYGFGYLWFWAQVIHCLVRYIINHISWSLAMIGSYLRIALRNVMKQKMYSVITVAGLSMGLGVFLFFFRFFMWALNADRFHEYADRIYTVVQVFDGGANEDRHSTDIPHPLIPELKEGIPEIEDATRLYWPGKMIVSREEESFFENGVCFVDPNFLSFFTYKTIAGNPQTMLSRPNTIVLDRTMAEKYFGGVSPLGRVLTLNNQVQVTVDGVVEDRGNLASLSTIYFHFLVSMETGRGLFESMDDWSKHNHTGFVRLAHGVESGMTDTKLDRVIQKYYTGDSGSPKRMYLFPMTDIAFGARHIDEYYGSDYLVPYLVFFIMGVLFLLIVGINFVNLSTARYVDRLREIGLRKVVGAQRSQLILQFIGESVLMTVAAMPLATLVYRFSCSTLSARIGAHFNLPIWTHVPTLVTFFIISILTGILAGLYPAFYLSSFRPVYAIIDRLRTHRGRGRLRRFLVVFQFVVSAILILLAVVWIKQTRYVHQVDYGYDRHNVIALPLSDENRSQIQPLKEMIMQHPEVVSISASYGLPSGWRTQMNVIPEGGAETEGMLTLVFEADYGFVETLDLQVIQGRDFSHDYRDDENFLITALMAKRLGWDNPVGRRLRVGDEGGVIVGVVKDFQFDVLYYPMAPAVLALEQDNLNYLLVELRRDGILTPVVEHIRKQWYRAYPFIPFEYYTLDDYFNQANFGSSQLVSEIMSSLGLIAVFFSCLGLLGLASYAARKRTKEIGIRKVLGASIPGLLALLGKHFLKLVVLSNLIAFPIAYLISKSLLEFAYTRRIAISADVFVFVGFLTILTAVIAVASQTVNAARANPVNSLKYE